MTSKADRDQRNPWSTRRSMDSEGFLSNKERTNGDAESPLTK